MALNAFLKLVGPQGAIKGSVVQKGREGSIMVIAVDHGIVRPRNPGSGLPLGNHSHKPLVITKELDQSSPLLWRALVGNESFSGFDLQFWTPNIARSSGMNTEIQHYTIRLSKAVICDIQFTMPNNKHPELARLSEFETVSFTYDRIEWLWNAGQISAADDWP